MSFPRYPTYKHSGVEWLGEVPEHWEVKKIRNFASFTGGGTPSRENLSFWGGPIPWVSPKDMKVERIIEAEEGITQEGLDGSSSSLVATGHILIVVRSGILRHTIPVAINAVEVAINQDMKAVRMVDKVCMNIFFLRWIQGLNNQLLLAWAKQGATVESVEQEYLSKTVLPLPTLAEQAAIITFLDHETAKIDALIAEQQRLIELLQEKRQAAISHAVTKGLNPNAPMKDSGVEWLGEVPEHWVVCNFQRFVQIAEGQVDPRQNPYADMPLIAPNHIQAGTGQLLGLETAAEQGAESGKYICNEGDVIYSKIRPSLRKACIAPCACLTSADMYPLRAHGRLSNEFLFRFLLSEQFSALAIVESERVAMPKINRDSLKSVALAIPPKSEQEDICLSIRVHSRTFDALIAEGQEAIVLLSERRSALISAAVTGQIDVRGLVPEDEAA